MTATTVKGSTDVEPGDLVRYSGSDRVKCNGVAEVVRATATRLTVKFPDGKQLTAAYTYKVNTRGLLPRTYTAYGFQRLDARDRWWHHLPKTPDVDAVCGAQQRCPTLIVKAAAWRDRPAEVTAQLDQLGVWLANEPPEGAR